MTSEQYARLKHSDAGGRLRGKRESVMMHVVLLKTTEFPIPSLVRLHYDLFWEFSCPVWAVAHKPGELPKTYPKNLYE